MNNIKIHSIRIEIIGDKIMFFFFSFKFEMYILRNNEVDDKDKLPGDIRSVTRFGTLMFPLVLSTTRRRVPQIL